MNIWLLLVFVLACQAVGGFGALFTRKAIPTWYEHLKKPWFRPPNWLFGPVWTLLYLLMGISGYLLWQKRTVGDPALAIFFVQLGLNGIWTPLFFGWKKIGLAFFEILLLWVFILLTIIFAWQISTWAAVLLVPYLAWVSFASILNFYLWRLNPKNGR